MAFLFSTLDKQAPQLVSFSTMDLRFPQICLFADNHLTFNSKYIFMATAHTWVRRIEFIIKDDITICNLFYEGDEPGTPWGGGWKTKSFGSGTPITDFMNSEIADYLMWPDGRVEK